MTLEKLQEILTITRYQLLEIDRQIENYIRSSFKKHF